MVRSMYISIDILKNFTCAMCSSCCRRPWMVTIDETTYYRNKVIFDGSGRGDEFSRVFLPLAGSDKGEYAHISKQPSGACWFLDNDGRCRLHKELGHNHLDSVCQLYPRYPMNTARGVEITFTFSCPTVLEFVNRVEPLRYLRNEEAPTSMVSEVYVEQVFPRQQSPHHPLRYYFELEEHIIDLLQWRGLPLGDRIGLVAATVEAVDKMTGDDDLPRRLTILIHRNYDYLEQFPSRIKVSQMTTEILMEHFLVNFVFKKPLYSLGLKRGLLLLTYFYRYTAVAAAATKNAAAALMAVKAAIVELELQFGHNRDALSRHINS